MFLTHCLRLLNLGPRPAKRVRQRKPAKRQGTRGWCLEQLEERVLLAFGVDKLFLGSLSGPQDYVYTAANKIVPHGSVDAGKYYDIVVKDVSGIRRNSFARTAAANFATTDNSYTVQAMDPASTNKAWS